MIGRVSLVFPSIAIDRKFDFADSWDATKNHKLMMFFTVVLLPVVIYIVLYIVEEMLIYIPGVVYILDLFSIFVMIWMIAALSFAYQIVIEGKDAC